MNTASNLLLLAVAVLSSVAQETGNEMVCPSDYIVVGGNLQSSSARRQLQVESSPIKVVRQMGNFVEFTVQNTTWFGDGSDTPEHLFYEFATDAFGSKHCFMEEGMALDASTSVIKASCMNTPLAGKVAIVRTFSRFEGTSANSATIPMCCQDPYAEKSGYTVKEVTFELSCEVSCDSPEEYFGGVTNGSDDATSTDDTIFEPQPTGTPTEAPVVAVQPTDTPTTPPTNSPTDSPTEPPTASPTNPPTVSPPANTCPSENIKSPQSRDLVMGSQLNGPHFGSRHGWAWPRASTKTCGRFASADQEGGYAMPCWVNTQFNTRVLNFDTGYFNFKFNFDQGMKATISMEGDSLNNSQGPSEISFYPSGASASTACTKPPDGTWSDYPIRLVRSGRYLHHWYSERVGCNGADDTRVEIKVTPDCVELHMVSLTGANNMNWLDSSSTEVLSSSTNGFASLSYCVECDSEISGSSDQDGESLSGCKIVKTEVPTDCCPLSPATSKDGMDLCGTGWTYQTCDASKALGSQMTQGVSLTTTANYPVRGDGHSFEVRLSNSLNFLADNKINFSVNNESDSWKKVKINFHIEKPRRITGVNGIIIDRASGKPTGIHVQMSKNWHEQRGTPKYYSYWWDGIAHFRVPKGTTDLQLVISFQYFKGLHAVSHSQLSLLGWGVNGLWEEVGLGSNGESITYEPHGHHRRQMILDTRPWLTCALGKTNCVGNVDYTQWTENHGGGDFLNAVDDGGRYQYLTKDAVFHTMNGPRLTNATYTGITQDQRISVSRTVSTWTADDFVRHLHSFNYEFLKDTPGDKYPRFSLYTLGGDNYNYVEFPTFAYGAGDSSSTETVDIADVLAGLTDFKYATGFYQVDAPVGCSQDGDTGSCWFSMMTNPAQNIHQRGHRGLIVRNFHGRLNGEVWPPPDRAVSPFAFHLIKSRQNGAAENTVSIELALPTEFRDAVNAGTASFKKGDFLSADLELLLPPRQTTDTFSKSMRLKQWLTDTDADASYKNGWKMTAREASSGDAIQTTVFTGTLERNYHPRIHVDCGSDSARFNLQLDTSAPGTLPITIAGVQSTASFSTNPVEGPSGKLWRYVSGNWKEFGSGGNYQLERDVLDNSYTFVYSLRLEFESDPVQACEQFAFAAVKPATTNPPCN